MVIEIDKEGTLSGLTDAIARTVKVERVTALVILVCADNGFTPSDIDPLLQSIDLPLMGGVFPNLLVGRQRLTRGSLVWGVRRPLSLGTIRDISQPTIDLELAVEQALTPTTGRALQVILVDGLSSGIGTLMNTFHEVAGVGSDTIGGGAGSLDFVQRPCVFTGEGMLQDAAVIATIPGHAGVGVAHGWRYIQGPYRITESDQNTIISLDWRPAFEVYREVVEAHSHQRFTDDNFFDLAKAYPFGLARMDAERIVRDPLFVREDGGLVCVGAVPEGDHVDILHGDAPSLIAAAASAKDIAEQRLDEPLATRIFMDCISRVLFLGDDFDTELASVAVDDIPLIGACTIGEVANHGGDYPEFYNKTSVVAALPQYTEF